MTKLVPDKRALEILAGAGSPIGLTEGTLNAQGIMRHDLRRLVILGLVDMTLREVGSKNTRYVIPYYSITKAGKSLT